MLEKVDEEWKQIEGYPMYMVSNFGRIMSHYDHTGTPRIIRGIRDKDGYERVCLYNDNGRKIYFIHRLVAKYFIPNPDSLPVVNHKDENKRNNMAENLEWCTVRENTVYHDMPKRRADALRIPIIQLDLDCNVVKRWRCRADIERETGFCGGNITRVCRGQRPTAHGYKWMYEEEAKRYART